MDVYDHSHPIYIQNAPLIQFLERIGMVFEMYVPRADWRERFVYELPGQPQVRIIIYANGTWGYGHYGSLGGIRCPEIKTEQQLTDFLDPTPLAPLIFAHKLRLLESVLCS